MSPRPGSRTQPCTREQARVRLHQAEAALEVAELILDEDDLAMPGMAASLAVISGIAACDAACCARLGKRPRGEAHIQAAEVLETVSPGGKEMAKDLRRLVHRKLGDSQYGMSFVSRTDAQSMVGWARRLIGLATKAVEA
jgi:hypothetical protein